jgi:RNA polymerase sigma-70 factor (ECF subfamily)
MRDRKGEKVLPLEDVGEIPDRGSDVWPEIDPQRLQEVLNDLPEDFRTPIVLFYFEDFSYRDIADQMKVPIGTVMSRLARAKTYLRNRLMEPPVLAAAKPEGENA